MGIIGAAIKELSLKLDQTPMAEIKRSTVLIYRYE